MFDLHHEIYTINNVNKPKINILTDIENRSSFLLQVGELQRLVRPCPFTLDIEIYDNPNLGTRTLS